MDMADQQDPDAVLSVELETQGCISCCIRRWKCDSARPRCSKCATRPLHICSYERTLSGLLAQFPSRLKIDDEIKLGRHDRIADQGSYGMVYRTSRKTGGHVAVKVLFPKKKTPGKILLLTLREAWTWSQLQHDHIVPLVGLADYSKICLGASSQLCLVSPWMDAGNVMEYLKQNPTADPKSLVLDIAAAICYLHARSPAVIHGDIRGNNILVDIQNGQPRARVTDFGLSSVVEESSQARSSTSSGLGGNPRWLAPERLNPEKFNLSLHTSKSQASDVFEMCRTFLEILSGDCPFYEEKNSARVVVMMEGGQYPKRPSLALKDLTDSMWIILMCGWRPEPQERPSAQDIHNFIAAHGGIRLVDRQEQEKPSGYVHRDPYNAVGSTMPETRRCTRCSALRLICDGHRPRCSRCAADKFGKCSSRYGLTVEDTIAFFPPEYDMNKKISLSSAENFADHGPFGKVYRTSLKGSANHVAVKILFQRRKTPQRLLLLALREALTWAQLRHEHIVPLIGVANYSKISTGSPPQLCLVSPWMSYGTAMDYLNNTPGADRRPIMLDIATAVIYLHSRRPVVIHGGIRGSNILVDVRDGRPTARLAGFGLSFIAEERDSIDHSTSLGRAGSPRWLAPERLFPEMFNLSPYTSRTKASDVFEMCRTFLEILSGQCPFFGLNEFQVVRMVDEGKHPDRPLLAVKALTDVMWTTMKRGWALDRQERPSAAEIRLVIMGNILKDVSGSKLKSPVLTGLSIPDALRMIEDCHGDPLDFMAFLDSVDFSDVLDSISFRFNEIHDAFKANFTIIAIRAISRILRTSRSLPILQRTLSLLEDIDRQTEERAPTASRSQTAYLYVDGELGLVDAELHCLHSSSDLDIEVEHRVRQHLNSLLSSSDIGEICCTWIICSGRLSTILMDFEKHTKMEEPEQEFSGLSLINCLATDATLNVYKEIFLDADLLPALSRCFDQKYCLYWDVIVAWKHLLERLLDLSKNDSPRHEALMKEQETGWKALVEPGRDVFMRGTWYDSALQAASHCGDEWSAKLLIGSGADVNAAGDPFGTALHAAARQGHETVVRVLLENGADVNTRGAPYGTALHAAVLHGHETVASILLDCGANVDAQAGLDETALHAAAGRGDEAMVKLLLGSKADVNACGGRYGTALKAAVAHGHDVVAQLLIQAGATPTRRRR